MEPINFEDDIRKKLQERELAPSDGAWAQLDARLAAANTSKKKAFPWLAVAAGFVGILILGSIFFSQTAGDVRTDIVLEVRTQPESVNTNEVIKQDDLVQEKTTEQLTNLVEVAVQETPKKQTTKPIMVSEQQKMIPNKIQQNTKITEAVAKNTPSKSTTEPSNSLEIEQKVTPQNIESVAVAQVVAQVKAIQNEQGVVTPANVDLLLSEAREKLQIERMLSSRKVDPAALLQDVESDLEESFRNKVFDALGSGFQKIRTAVVERNN